MRNLLPLLALLLIAAAFSLHAVAQDIADTPENREAQADRYLAATPPRDLFADMAKKMAANLPPEQRDQIIQTLTTQVDMDAVDKAMKAAIVKHFTAEEIKALADFYGSPVGKSAMSKFGDYMADVMPTIQAEMAKAEAKENQLLENKAGQSAPAAQ